MMLANSDIKNLNVKYFKQIQFQCKTAYFRVVVITVAACHALSAIMRQHKISKGTGLYDKIQTWKKVLLF